MITCCHDVRYLESAASTAYLLTTTPEPGGGAEPSRVKVNRGFLVSVCVRASNCVMRCSVGGHGFSVERGSS